MSDPREVPVTVQSFFNQSPELVEGQNSHSTPSNGSKGPSGGKHGARNKKEQAGQRLEDTTPSQTAQIDASQTQELTSMLNVLGFQLGEAGTQPASVDLIDQLGSMNFGQEDDKKYFICRNLMLLEEGILKVYTKDQEGSYFSNIQTFGSRLTKAAIDRRHGRFVAVGGEEGVFILTRALTDDKLELYHTLSIGKPKEMWFSSTGRFLSLFSRKESKNWLLVVDLNSKSVVSQ